MTHSFPLNDPRKADIPKCVLTEQPLLEFIPI